MKFKPNFSPNTWMLINSAFIVILLTFLYIGSALILHAEIHLLPLIITDIGVFLVSFFLYRYLLETFIYSRIKLIYKTIHTLKRPKGENIIDLNLNKDIIGNMKREVISWAQDKKEEIEGLKKLEAYRREFIGNVSHELKTPLFNIQGYVLTLLEGALKDPATNREYLLRSERNIERMIAIVEDLEVISRLETGELVLDMTHVDIHDLARETMELLETKSKRRGIHFIFREDYSKPIYVEADKERIRQVFLNLFDNSIKYGRENGRTKVSFYDMDEHWLVEVSDDGIGIDQKDIPRLFERFYRVDKSRSRDQGGSGLGLAIVKHIIEAHGQTINVRSKPGIGTTFSFTLRKG